MARRSSLVGFIRRKFFRQLHRVENFRLSDGPHFDGKIRDIVGP